MPTQRFGKADAAKQTEPVCGAPLQNLKNQRKGSGRFAEQMPTQRFGKADTAKQTEPVCGASLQIPKTSEKGRRPLGPSQSQKSHPDGWLFCFGKDGRSISPR